MLLIYECLFILKVKIASLEKLRILSFDVICNERDIISENDFKT